MRYRLRTALLMLILVALASSKGAQRYRETSRQSLSLAEEVQAFNSRAAESSSGRFRKIDSHEVRDGLIAYSKKVWGDETAFQRNCQHPRHCGLGFVVVSDELIFPLESPELGIRRYDTADSERLSEAELKQVDWDRVGVTVIPYKIVLELRDGIRLKRRDFHRSGVEIRAVRPTTSARIAAPRPRPRRAE